MPASRFTPDLSAAMRPRQRRTMSDDVYDSLKASIMDNVIPPQARITIDQLVKMLEVSQTPIREALARLESEGLVEKQAQIGYSATRLLNMDEVEKLFGFRSLIEPWAAAQAAQSNSADAVARLKAELDSVAHVQEGSAYGAYRFVIDHDARFHDLILELAGNDFVRDAFDRTHCHFHLYRRFYHVGMGDQTIKEHQAIVDAMAQGPEAAEAAMRLHLELSLQRTLHSEPNQPSQ